MAGIVGYVGDKQAGPIILEGLRKLEYRGYDAAGMAVGSPGSLRSWHAEGKLRNLEAAVRLESVEGTVGVGHTSWDTGARRSGPGRWGKAASDGIAIALSGKPSNIKALRARLGVGAGCMDAEVVARLISSHSGPWAALEDALGQATLEIEGRCAIAAVLRDEPDKIVAAHLGLPMVVGLGKQENFVTSDIPAILSRTRDIIRLEYQDLAVLTASEVLVLDTYSRPVYRPVHHVLWDPIMAEKSGYKHLMLKEIFEQPRAIRETVLGRIDVETGKVVLDELGLTARELVRIRHLNMIGSGSSWHAGLAAKAMIEQMARIHVEAEYGSEFRYSDPVVDEHVLSLVISKSGETADTIASQQLLHRKGSNTIAVCNSVSSTIANSARGAIYTKAGPELAAASTKSLSSQLTAMFLFATCLAQVRGLLSKEASANCARDLMELPGLVESALELSGKCKSLARTIAHAGKVLYLGRGRTLRDRARGGAHAEGAVQHPGRRLRGRGNAAWPDGPDRRGHGGRRSRHRRRAAPVQCDALPEDTRAGPGDDGPEGTGDLHCERRRRPARRPCPRGHSCAGDAGTSAAGGRTDPATAAGLSRGRLPRQGR